MARGVTFTRQTFWTLLGSLLLVQLITAAFFAWFVLKPLAQRTASDLAALMVLSAQTWSELPPETRLAFEEELLRNHQLRVQPHPLPFQATHSSHPLFFNLLEDEVGARIKQPTELLRQTDERQIDWYWSWLPAGRDGLWIAVSEERVNTSPVLAFLLSLATGLVLTLVSAIWLSRRMTKPLLNLQESVVAMSRGEQPKTAPIDAPLEIKSLHHEFVELSRQVDALLTSRTVLFAGISHDLRSPLARLNLGLEMIRTAPSPALIDKLQQDVEHMNTLIGQVMELAKGLENDPPTTIHWRSWINHLIEQENLNDRVQVMVDPAIPNEVLVAPIALQRAIMNLLRNAVQYDASDSPIELQSHWKQGLLNICILDRGPGIPSDQIESMLRPFERMDKARSSAGKGGHGLGLAIVVALARNHAWEFQLIAREGGGLAAHLNHVAHDLNHVAYR
ncbi:MAG: signal transduction histidine kinase [Pseudomonadota bacterium]|jgi:two-component system osmolarity sensor histidine kinase EnvZ